MTALDTFLDKVKMECQAQNIKYCRAAEYVAIAMYRKHKDVTDVIKAITANPIQENFHV